MPELPEVETTRRGLEPLIRGQRIADAVVRNRNMRLPVPRALPAALRGATIITLSRRGKYLMIDCDRGTLIIHLGMSGRLWVVTASTALDKHDHFDLVIANGVVVRLRDPRRFGLVLWQPPGSPPHRLLSAIGPEPLTEAFDGEVLHRATRNRASAIKLVIMDSHVVAGVGNIYANEALFRAGIDPRMPAKRLTRTRCDRLAATIRETLTLAIDAGGSSLRDYVGSDGMAGNFQNHFLVYGRGGQPCTVCGSILREIKQGQRATCYCPSCQKR